MLLPCKLCFLHLAAAAVSLSALTMSLYDITVCSAACRHVMFVFGHMLQAPPVTCECTHRYHRISWFGAIAPVSEARKRKDNVVIFNLLYGSGLCSQLSITH